MVREGGPWAQIPDGRWSERGGGAKGFRVQLWCRNLTLIPMAHALPWAYTIYLLIHKLYNSSFHPPAIRLRNNWGESGPPGHACVAHMARCLSRQPYSFSPGSLTPLLSVSFCVSHQNPALSWVWVKGRLETWSGLVCRRALGGQEAGAWGPAESWCGEGEWGGFSLSEGCVELSCHRSASTVNLPPQLLGTELRPGWRCLQRSRPQTQQPVPGSACLTAQGPQGPRPWLGALFVLLLIWVPGFITSQRRGRGCLCVCVALGQLLWLSAHPPPQP